MWNLGRNRLGRPIWLNFVKRTVLLLSESFHFFFRLVFTAFWTGSETGTLLLRLFHAEMRESTRGAPGPHEGINRSRSDAAFVRSLGTRFGLGTASNDPRESRLTGSLSLARSSRAGFGFHRAVFS